MTKEGGQQWRGIAAATLTAAVGGYLLHLAGLPVGWLVGSMIATAALNLLRPGVAQFPPILRRAGEFLLGASIGSYFTATVITFLLTHLLSVTVAVGGAVLSGVVCGRIFLKWSRLDPATAFYATTVGGSAEMAALARAEGGDDRVVAAYHSIRILLVVFLIPLTLSFLYPVAPVAIAERGGLAPELLLGQGLALLIAGAGAWAARKLRLPGAILLGGVIAIGLANSLGADLPVLPREVRFLAQVLVGGAIGSNFDLEILGRIRSVLRLHLLLTVLLLVMSAGWAATLHFTTGIDWLTAILSTAPAGSSDMTATAIALGADVSVVASLQLLRVIVVSVAMPFIIRRMAT